MVKHRTPTQEVRSPESFVTKQDKLIPEHLLIPRERRLRPDMNEKLIDWEVKP